MATRRNPDQLAEVLDAVVERAPGAAGVVVEEWRPPANEAPDESAIDVAFDALAEVFESTVAALQESWGEPTWKGAVDEADFPAWSEALILATWERGEIVAFVALRADDPSLPIFVELGAVTRDEAATLAIGRTG